MYLIRAFSHNPLTGKPKVEILMLPAGTISARISKTITERTRRLANKMKRPLEIGFVYNPQKSYAGEIYTKPLLMSSEGKIKAVLSMLSEGYIKKDDALSIIDYQDVLSMSFSRVERRDKSKILANGEPGYPGAVSGQLVFNIEDLDKFENPIWALGTITNLETKSFYKAKGLILTKAGATSHAAILSRNLGIPSIFGCGELLAASNLGVQITIDGSTGKVYEGNACIVINENQQLLGKLERVCLSNQKFEVMVNAENSSEIEKAIASGAKGVGLCRTEHMFMTDERLKCVQDILFNERPKQKNLDDLMDFQKQDFIDIFRSIGSRPITIRYLDAPLHEFGGIAEENPMLGFRGARMLLLRPDIIKIQTRAIFSALKQVKREKRPSPKVILELPLVTSTQELQLFKQIVADVIIQEFPKFAIPVFAAMIETPASALIADKIAKEVDYVSFGSNDLTQMTMGLSRDDTKPLIKDYLGKGIYKQDPFTSIIAESVGELMKIAIKKARKANPSIKISICGEQAGDPNSMAFLKNIGINSISVSQSKIKSAIFWSAKTV